MGALLALLFAAAGAAAGGMTSAEAGQLLVVSESRLPAFAPDPQVRSAVGSRVPVRKGRCCV